MSSVLVRHVVNANLNQLLLFELPITIKSSISESPDEIKESFEGLLLSIVKSEDGNLSSPWKYFEQKLSTMSSHVAMEPDYRVEYHV